MRKIFGYLLTVIALIGMGIGFVTLYQIEMRLINAVPVPVRITGKRLDLVDEITRDYVARAAYQYNVDGDLYIGDKVLPYDFSTRITSYLEDVINPLNIDEISTAYYNRNNPSDSFLRKAIPYPPYMMLLTSLFLFISGLFMIMVPGKNNPEPVPASGGWFRFPAGNANLSEMKDATMTQAVVFSVISVLTFCHYFYHAMRPYSIWVIGTVCSFILIGSVLWKQAMVCKKQADQFDDLFLEINAPVLQFDTEYMARIRQKVRRPTEIVSLDLAVTAHKENSFGDDLNRIWYQNPKPITLQENEEVKQEQTFKISSKNDFQYSGKIAWSLEARVVSASGVQEWSFPVTVISTEPK